MLDPLLQGAPWLTSPVHLTPEPKGMLRAHEAALFHWLARTQFTGAGTIVDAGSFLGKSASYFTHGLRANPRFDPDRDRVHCFDNFLVNDPHTVGYLQQEFGLQRAVGSSTLDLFEAQVAPVRDLIEVHAGDFHTVAWERRPVEILLVDIAKSPSLGCRLVELFFRDLLPGRSYVVQQDYHHPWLPHIHVVMEFLSPWFELVVPRCDDSALFRLREALPEAAWRRVVADDFDATERLALMDQAIQRLPEGDRHHVELARVLLRGQLLDWETAHRELQAVLERYDHCRGEPQWVHYLENVQDAVDESAGWQRKARGDVTGTLEIANAMLARGALHGGALVMRGWALRMSNQLSASEASLRAAITLPKHSGFTYSEWSLTLLAQGRHREAEQALVDGLLDVHAKPGLPTRSGLELLAAIWEAERNLGAIRATMVRLRRDLAREAEFWAFAARVHVRLGERAEGLQALRQAIRLGLPTPRQQEVLADYGLSLADWALVAG